MSEQSQINDDTDDETTLSAVDEAALKNAVLAAFAEGLRIKWEAAPTGFKCLACGEEALERTRSPMIGPYSGSIRCTKCGHTMSVSTYLGKTCITVEPLPPPL